MRPLSDAEVARRAESFAATLQDRCVILRWNGTAHVADDDEMPCRFRTAQQQAGVGEPIFLAGATSPGMVITLAPDANLGPLDRIRMTARKQQTISPAVDYIQESAPSTDLLATIARLRRAMP